MPYFSIMDDHFELPVYYKNKEQLFPAEFQRAGYSYKIQVDVYGQLIMFEPDEERNWRALVNMEEIHKIKTDHGLIQAIIEALNRL